MKTAPPTILGFGSKSSLTKVVVLFAPFLDQAKPAEELNSRAAPSVEAHQCSEGSDAGRNSRERQIIKKNLQVNASLKMLGI